MTRQSGPGGDASRRSTAAVKLLGPAFTNTARRPPNSGTVWASSRSRSGVSASVSPSMSASANGSRGSSTAARTSASVRSRTSPASGPKMSATGLPGSGRATNRAMSAPLSATMASCRRSGSGDEIRGETRLDVDGDQLGGAVLAVAQPARPRKPLRLARNIIGHARKRIAGEDGRAGLQLHQAVIDREAVILDIGTAAVDVDDDGKPVRLHLQGEPVRRRRGGAAAGEIEQELVSQLDGDPGLRGAVGSIDLRDIDTGQFGADARPAGEGMLAIKRLKAPGERGAGGADADQAQQAAASCDRFKPPH